MTQSAVSQQVRTLETKLGQALFERRAKSLALTDAGRRLVPFAASAIAELIKGTEMFTAPQGREAVAISCTTSFAQLWLAPKLAGFTRANLDIAIQITSTLWPDDYLNRQTDVEVHFARSSQMDPQARLLMPVNFEPVCAPALSGPVNEIDDLWHLPLIETVGALYGWSRWARQFGVSLRPPAAYTVDSIILAQTMATAGLGVALISPALCFEALNKGQIHTLLNVPIPAEHCFYISIREAAASRPAVRTFCDWLEDAARGNKADNITLHPRFGRSAPGATD